MLYLMHCIEKGTVQKIIIVVDGKYGNQIIILAAPNTSIKFRKILSQVECPSRNPLILNQLCRMIFKIKGLMSVLRPK